MADHPLTPPYELVEQWRTQAPTARDAGASRERWIAIQAARWGDDQRLEMCRELVKCSGYPVLALQMLAAMRPKPKSLAEQAEQELFAMRKCANKAGYQAGDLIIDRALKRLAELEALSDAESPSLCPQGEHAPAPEPLSPAAQAILAAFDDRYEVCGPLEDSWQAACLAAAIRALADAVVPEERSLVMVCDYRRQRQRTRRQILSYATELEP